MKKLLLLSAAIGMGATTFAQGVSKTGVIKNTNRFPMEATSGSKTTADGDTMTLLNFPGNQLDSLTFYYADSAPFDSGYAYGTNPYGDKAWAERYDFNGVDSTVNVIGAVGIFEGSYASGTNKVITMKAWSQGPMAPATDIGPTWFYNGMPNTELATTANISIVAAIDSGTLFTTFATPTGALSDSFFVGYTINYNWTGGMGGDTLGLVTTRDGYRYADYYFTSGTDSIVNVKNAAQFSDNSWHDLAFDNFGQGLHLCAFPILVIDYVQSVNGVTKNNFTLFGSYPNPATTATTVKYAVKNATTVTVTVMDMTGRTISKMDHGKVNAGENTVSINTANLAAGNYVYLIRTGEGDGMAAQFTVAK